jgi:hypothetical protein
MSPIQGFKCFLTIPGYITMLLTNKTQILYHKQHKHKKPGCTDKMMYYLWEASQVVKRKGCRGTMGAPPSDSAEKNSALSCNTT